ncbi:hypothetical protein OV450_3717 [Actinobacteria bacterium OV450]|nr:hypothetical protein OV450_3717 [Actinobacteria bacterium OV450]
MTRLARHQVGQEYNRIRMTRPASWRERAVREAAGGVRQRPAEGVLAGRGHGPHEQVEGGPRPGPVAAAGAGGAVPVRRVVDGDQTPLGAGRRRCGAGAADGHRRRVRHDGGGVHPPRSRRDVKGARRPWVAAPHVASGSRARLTRPRWLRVGAISGRSTRAQHAEVTRLANRPARRDASVPAHSVTVVPGTAGRRTGGDQGNAEPSPTPEKSSSTSPVELLQLEPVPGREPTGAS